MSERDQGEFIWPTSFLPLGLPGKPPVTMLHGFLGSFDDWRDIGNMLAQDHTLTIPNLPGHNGKLFRPLCDFSAFVDKMGIGPCSLVGYSMGARIALAYAISHPDRVTRLVLESVHPGIEDEQQRAARLQHDLALAEEIRALPDHDAMEAWLRTWYAQPMWESLQARPELLETVIAKHRKQYRKSLALGLELMSVGKQPNLWPRLCELKIPTLVIAGELDTKYADIALRMADCNDNIAAMIMSGCGHNVHLESPDAYATVLKSFLSG